MSLTSQEIEKKIAELEEQSKKHSTYMTEINQAIEKLSTDKNTVIGNLQVMNGAIQAYKDILNKVTSGAEVSQSNPQE